MLMVPVRAASSQRSSLAHSSSALATPPPLASKEVSCHTMVSRPRATPTGRTSTLHTGTRERKSPAAIPRIIRSLRSGVGTQLACSTDRTTTNRFKTKRPTANQPSEGRKTRITRSKSPARASGLARSLRVTAPARLLEVTVKPSKPKFVQPAPLSAGDRPRGISEPHSGTVPVPRRRWESRWR